MDNGNTLIEGDHVLNTTTQEEVNLTDVTLSVMNNNDKRDEDFEDASSVKSFLVSGGLYNIFCL
jgi:hypothetical protein